MLRALVEKAGHTQEPVTDVSRKDMLRRDPKETVGGENTVMQMSMPFVG